MKKFLARLKTMLPLTITPTQSTDYTVKEKKLSVEECLRSIAIEADCVSANELVNWKNQYALVGEDDTWYLVNKALWEPIYAVEGISVFYDTHEIEFGEVKFRESTQQLDEKYYKIYEDAKTLAYSFIDSSVIIKKEQKEHLKNVIENVKLHYGVLEDYLPQAVMATYRSTDIYLVKGREDRFCVASFLHELIHIISNETNRNSKYEFSVYRSGLVNEGLTELITRTILHMANRDDEINESVVYKKVFEFVYALMLKVDLIKAYFYSDYFNVILSKVGEEWFNMYYMCIECEDEEALFINKIPYRVLAQF